MENRDLRKQLLMSAIILMLTFTLAGAVYGADAAAIMDTPPFVKGGHVFAPVRPVAETFGISVGWVSEVLDGNAELYRAYAGLAPVGWVPNGYYVTLTRADRRLIMQIGSPDMVLITYEGEQIISMDIAPDFRDNRVFLPPVSWTKVFGFTLTELSENSVVISDGDKKLTLTREQRELKLSGGNFLKSYNGDKSLTFFYPIDGAPGVAWEGYAEILLTIGEADYVITAVNAGAGRSDPVRYTLEELDHQMEKNAETDQSIVRKLADVYYGVPAYRFSGIHAGIPQAGLVFLKDGVLCGLTVEAQRDPGSDIFVGNELELDTDNGTEALPEAGPVEIDESELQSRLAVINALLDEIMPSFTVM